MTVIFNNNVENNAPFTEHYFYQPQSLMQLLWNG